MKIFCKFVFLGLFSLLGGCAKHYYEAPQAALIVIKSPELKYADMGFVYRGKKQIKMQIYVSGRAAFTLTIGKRICIDSRCMSEEQFYKKYLHVRYPKGTLADIFSKRAIFGGEDLHEEKGKKVQHIYETGRFDIIYAFDATSVRFKDRINHILIKITEK